MRSPKDQGLERKEENMFLTSFNVLGRTDELRQYLFYPFTYINFGSFFKFLSVLNLNLKTRNGKIFRFKSEGDCLK